MGSPSRITGVIRIEPPLRWSEYRDSPYLRNPDHDLTFVEAVEREDTADGTVTTRHAVGIRAVGSGEHRNYYAVEEDLKAVVAGLEKLERDRLGGFRFTLTGFLTEYDISADPATVYRYRLDGDRAVRVDRAELRWPDGTAVEV